MEATEAIDAGVELDRARADYLAVSRCAHLYSSTEDYERAEVAVWERLQEALEGSAVRGPA